MKAWKGIVLEHLECLKKLGDKRPLGTNRWDKSTISYETYTTNNVLRKVRYRLVFTSETYSFLLLLLIRKICQKIFYNG